MQMAVGTVIGIAMGEIMRRAFNALDLELEGIYPVLSVALALLTYGLTDYWMGAASLPYTWRGSSWRESRLPTSRVFCVFTTGWPADAGHHVLGAGATSIPARLVPIAGVGILVSLFPSSLPPGECPCGAGLFADVLSRTDAGGLGRTSWGRANFRLPSPSWLAREGRHDLPFGVSLLHLHLSSCRGQRFCY